MKIARIFVKTCFFISLFLSVLIFSAAVYLGGQIGSDYKLKIGETLSFDTKVPITAVYDGIDTAVKNTLNTVGKEYEIDLKMFGVIPYSTVNVEVVDESKIVVLGTPYGMKLYTDGVLVIGLTDIITENGKCNPAREQGIKKGDYIYSVDGQKVTTNEELCEAVENSEGRELTIVRKRNGKRSTVKIKPIMSIDSGVYKIGVWVRDSSAGIGTLTFYSPADDIICGLGHGICDEDTGKLLKLKSGEFVSAEIISTVKGEVGTPGQLNGKLGSYKIGDIILNSDEGVYAKKTSDVPNGVLTEIVLKQDIIDGEAQILCCIDGKNAEYYSCNVKVRTGYFYSDTQNMTVTVTDERLLEATGGIVQGLSGSPILQNGKLIGAVTHVLIDDPTTGYAIFAENMLEVTNEISNEIKKAS